MFRYTFNSVVTVVDPRSFYNRLLGWVSCRTVFVNPLQTQSKWYLGMKQITGEWWQWSKLPKQCSDLLLEVMLTCHLNWIKRILRWISWKSGLLGILKRSLSSLDIQIKYIIIYKKHILRFTVSYIYYLNLCHLKKWPTKELCHGWHARDPLCGGGRPRISAMNRFMDPWMKKWQLGEWTKENW